MAETKTVVIHGVKIVLQRCEPEFCVFGGKWFNKTRKGKESCSNRCTQRKSKKWQNRNKDA